MVKLKGKFFAGDKVFAKVRGYPAWPARVEGVTDANTKNAKYNVYFYGTGETAVCKVEELFTYMDNKDKFTKPLKRKIFHEGLQQLEQELRNDKGKAASLEDLKEPAFAGEASDKASPDAAVSAADSDMESGPLVIDEGDKKKPTKRKLLASTPNNPDTPELKKKRGRGKGSTASMSEGTPKQEAAVDSQGEETSPGKEVVSRSGRKIKPKRFADFSSSEEAEIGEKNENSSRARGKSKIDESNENQASPSGGPNRKKTGTEKKSDIGDATGAEDKLKPITTSSDAPSARFLLARTLAGEYVGIKLDIDRPKSFDSEKARVRWDNSVTKSAMKMKARLESGEILTEHVKDSLDFNVNVPEDDKKLLAKDGVMQRKKYKLRIFVPELRSGDGRKAPLNALVNAQIAEVAEAIFCLQQYGNGPLSAANLLQAILWLRIESQLLQLDAQIKSNLGLDRADADKCLQAMDDMLALPIDPLMLKKHPHIVETVKRLRRYIGNLADWKLTEEEVTAFKQKAEQIKQKAEHIYNKFKAMFTIPEGQSFWQSFSDQVVHFKELTKDMPEEKMFSLMADPACPDVAAPTEVPSTDESLPVVETSTVPEVDPDALPTRCATPVDSAAK